MTHPQAWQFEPQSEKHIFSDPIAEEFFRGTDEEGGDSTTDILVREAIQNSLDAAADDGPVSVRFWVAPEETYLSPERSQVWLGGLRPHLKATGLHQAALALDSPIPFLVIEDFGTAGLQGDVAWNGRGDKGDERQDFFYFWRNVGRSGKGGEDRGRWGLGKTVFQAASSMHAVFGLTHRADDKSLLMGQAVLKIHEHDGQQRHPYGFFCDARTSEQIQMPFEEVDTLDRFRRDFHISRRAENGLTLVIPMLEGIHAKALLQSVVRHWFMPILRNRLRVTVSGPGLATEVEVDHRSLGCVTKDLDWKMKAGDRGKPIQPPIELAQRTIERIAQEDLTHLCQGDRQKVPRWSDVSWPDGMLEHARRELDEGRLVSVHVPMTLEKKNEGMLDTYFALFLEKVPGLEWGEDFYVRSGMTISDIRKLGGRRGIRGLLLVDDRALSTFLGDAEGPSHATWGTNERRPDRAYVKWKGRVTFVRDALVRILQMLELPPEDLREDLLQEIFHLENGGGGLTRKKRKRRASQKPDGDTESQREIKVDSNAMSFRVEKGKTGFQILPGTGEPDLPMKLQVRVAYDIAVGNPFKAWSHHDFRFDPGKRRGIVMDISGAVIEKTGDNRILLDIREADFRVDIEGFNPLNDLIVDARVIEVEDQ